MLNNWLNRINSRSEAEFVAALGHVFENSPWVAAAAAGKRPFATARAVHDAMVSAVRQSDREQHLALIRAHPELAGREALAGALTAASTSEQSRLGLTRLAPSDVARLGELNRRYRERFAMPCIIALRRHRDLASVLSAFEARLSRSSDEEISAAIDEIAQITEGRLETMLGLTDGRLSTHVLDTTRGLPAAGMAYELSVRRAGSWVSLQTGFTNDKGGTDQALLRGLDMEVASYRLAFSAGDYFRGNRTPGTAPAFLDIIPIEFAIAAPGEHYHLPLLCSPWSYATYRGTA